MGGFFGPNAQDLLHIRKQLAQDAEPLREVVGSKQFNDQFGNLLGDQVKSAPRGFPKDHENIDLLRYMQFMVRQEFSQAQVVNENFPETMARSFAAMLPFFDVMTMYLTTDLNGETLI